MTGQCIDGIALSRPNSNLTVKTELNSGNLLAQNHRHKPIVCTRCKPDIRHKGEPTHRVSVTVVRAKLFVFVPHLNGLVGGSCKPWRIRELKGPLW